MNVRSSDGSSWEPEWLRADVLIDLDDDGAPTLPPASHTNICVLCEDEIDCVSGECTGCNNLWGEPTCLVAGSDIEHGKDATMQVRLPTQDIVLNVCSGNYYNKDGFSAKGRKLNVGMLDVDNDPMCGGGAQADITNNACLQFLEDLTDSRRVAGIACGQPCAPG